MAESFDKLIDSPIADMKNVGPREGGSITAAQFIQPLRRERHPLGAPRHCRDGLVGQAEQHLRQGRDRLWRQAHRPLRRSVGGGALTRWMQIDFYQLGRTPLEQVIASIAQKLLAGREAAADRCRGRRAAVAGSTACCGTRARPASFRTASPAEPTMRASRSCSRPAPTRPNLARNMLIADGQWREAALAFDRAFYLFDAATLEGARLAWKLLAGREGVERRYWAQDERRASGSEKA